MCVFSERVGLFKKKTPKTTHFRVHLNLRVRIFSTKIPKIINKKSKTLKRRIHSASFVPILKFLKQQIVTVPMLLFSCPQDGSRVSGMCGGYCGKCIPSSGHSLPITVE